MAKLILDGVAQSYKPNPSADPADWALKEISQSFEHGGAYALLGPSGCGKTTLLNILSGLVTPTRGTVRFGDHDVTRTPTEARNIAQVFQFPVVYDTMTVGENLAFPLKNRGVDAATIRARVAEIAELLDLSQELGRKARGLTADAKQKISLGRGLVRPDVAAVLFDEPLTVIDPQLKWELRSKLKALHAKLEVTMIYVTHDQTEALTFADQVVMMLDGEVVQAGTPEALFERPEHKFVGHFIGSPGMNFLPCQLNGTTATINGSIVPLGRRYAAPPGATLELGVRPEYATLAPAGVGLPAILRRIEDLGRVRLARVEVAGSPTAVTIPDGAAISGDAVSIAIQPERASIYADGRRLVGEEI